MLRRFCFRFASALRCATPDAVSQSDSASGAGLVFSASSAAAVACAAAAAAAFLLAIQRKDKKGLPADARSKNSRSHRVCKRRVCVQGAACEVEARNTASKSKCELEQAKAATATLARAAATTSNELQQH